MKKSTFFFLFSISTLSYGQVGSYLRAITLPLVGVITDQQWEQSLLLISFGYFLRRK
jgi:hypothetical protein